MLHRKTLRVFVDFLGFFPHPTQNSGQTLSKDNRYMAIQPYMFSLTAMITGPPGNPLEL